MKETYSIYDAKTHLSRLLKRVKAGAELIISDRGRPIAKVIPYQAPKNFADRLDSLVHSKIVAPRQIAEAPKGQKTPGALDRFLTERE